MCQVSVVTSVYNCEKYIRQTIESVINQTFTDWEFIIIDDCSKDKSAEIIQSYRDERIVFLQNETNKGQCASLNYGIQRAKGKYIARLDHDDICYNNRFEKQVEYMENHPDVVLCGACNDLWVDGKIKKGIKPVITGMKEVGFSLAFGNYCISHSSFMIRKSSLVENRIQYDTRFHFAEDYRMLTQLLIIGKIDYIEESLIAYRVFPEQLTQKCPSQVKDDEFDQIRCEYIDAVCDNDKEILKRGILGKIRNRADYELFERAFITHAVKMGMDINNLSNNQCIKMIYKDIIREQDRNPSLLITYLKSQYKDKNWLKSKSGIRFIVSCFISFKPREKRRKNYD